MRTLSARTRFWVVGGILILLQALDGLLTTATLQTGLVREGNLLMAGIAGAHWFWIVKLLVTAALVGFLYVRIQGDEAKYIRVTKILAIASLVYVGIVLWNGYWLYAAVNGVMV